MNELAQALAKANQIVQEEAIKRELLKELLAILHAIIPGFILPGFGAVNELDEEWADQRTDAECDQFASETIAECEARDPG